MSPDVELELLSAACRVGIYFLAGMYAWNRRIWVGAAAGFTAGALVAARELGAHAWIVQPTSAVLAALFAWIVIEHAGYARRRRVLERDATTP